MLTVGIVLAALFGAALITLRTADLREAQIEARYPPTGQIMQVDGAEVHVQVVGEGPDLVLIHGAGSNTRDMWLGLGQRLAETHRVFLVDRPGHGWTGRMNKKLSSTWATDAESPAEQAALLSEAVTELGARNPIVVGHSYGGAVAMAWGLAHPASALVIVSGVTLPWPGDVDITYRVLGSGPGGAILAPLGAAFVPDTYVQSILEQSFAPEAVPTNYLRNAAIPMAIRTETLRANNRQVNTLRPKVVEQSSGYDVLTLPIEILHGTEDTTVYLDVHARPLADRMANANLTILDGAGHMTHHTRIDDILAAVGRATERAGLR